MRSTIWILKFNYIYSCGREKQLHKGGSGSRVFPVDGSFQIKQLETELGVQLFERINHTVVLTEKGREVLKFAQTVHQMTRSLKDSILHSETITGHVRLAMADSLCGVMLEDFGTFRQQYPGITLKITAAGTQEMFRLLNHNEADLILTLDSHIIIRNM